MSKLLCKLGFHKWKYVKKPYIKRFLDEDIIKYGDKFRICQRCGLIEEITPFFHINLEGEEERKILLRKVIDKGNYYILPKQKEDKND